MHSGPVELCEKLEWDTTFWGFQVARVRGNILTSLLIEQIDEWCRQSEIGCLYFLARSNDANTVRIAEDSHFRLVDIRVTMEYSPQRSRQSSLARPESGIVVRESRPEDVNKLRDIARTCYRDTRFYVDPAFPTQMCDRLYETWIERSCEGFADAVLVAELDDQLVGYVTCHIGDNFRSGKIGLVGVSSEAKGRGVGQLLVSRALQWFESRGAQEVTVVTQGRNLPAQRLYQRCEFLTKAVELWYHKWYSNSEFRVE